MSGIDWASGDVVLACQLLSAGTLAAQLLILRPRGARQDLLLDARIVQDELDLAERLGHVAASNVETIAVQQVLRRIRQNPHSAGLVLERIPVLCSAASRSAGRSPTDVEYLGGALDRLSDAIQRYLRGAWPRARALPAANGSAPSRNLHRKAPIQDQKHRREIDVKSLVDDADGDSDPNNGDLNNSDLNKSNLGNPALDNPDLGDADLNDADPNDAGLNDADLNDADLNDADLNDADLNDADRVNADLDDIDVKGTTMDDANSHRPAKMLDLSDDEYAELFGDDLNYEANPNPIPAQRSTDDGAPAWMDLVQAETPRRISGLGLADRHARPYRPARSSGHSSARRAEQLDRSSVLPR